ncbi:MAG: threonine synthase [Acidobacteria bacterium RIFCSPLOWO2_12_FULL_66_10]|nr:MAG: threonine synthase [Acidobacteria bacterium RIFCSPLOWO2_12_FULL_66_10]
MRYLTTRGGRDGARPVSFTTALLDGLAPDGGLYVPETIEPWTASELSRLPRRTLSELGLRTLRPFTRGDIDPATLEALTFEALNFPIPLVEIEPRVYALELFHGPTLAFKDVGARVMARLMASIHEGEEPLTVLVATSGDTGSAVAHAFYRVPNTRVVILYPDGRVSPTQEAQLTMFNGERANVRAYAVAGSFDDCHRLTRDAFGDADLRQAMRLTSANSVNVGRLLPQMVYYFHAVAQLMAAGAVAPAQTSGVVCSTPSGNFGNLTAGLMAKRSGLPITRFIAATNANDVVPSYLDTGRFEPRPSVQTLSNAMDVGHPSNFERMLWLYGGNLDVMRRDVVGARHTDDDVRETIRQVYEQRGYLLDPHSAIGYRGLQLAISGLGKSGVGVFLATAHPAKFAEIVDPIVGRAVEKPEALASALARPRPVIRIDASLNAVRGLLTND